MDYIQKIDTSSLNFKRKEITPCKERNEKEKEIAQALSTAMHDEEMYKELNLMKVNFDVEIIKHKVYIRNIYLIKENCDVIQVPYNQLLTKKNKQPFTFRKVGAFMFPLGTPSLLNSYAGEMKESIENTWIKIVFATIVSSVVGFLGIKLIGLVIGLLVISILDLILGLIPGNVKEGTEKDHTIQAKFLAFTTNFVGIVAITKGMEYLLAFSGDAKVVSEYVLPYLPYALASWCFSVYFYRIVKYMARANRTRLPKTIKKMFNDDVSA
ncbi:hypothetical protein D3C74_194000 [compost metagenome]